MTDILARDEMDERGEPSGKQGISTLASEIHDALFARIVTGDLPPGLRLEEKTIAAQFNTSRTPVREALRELAARQLIEFKPRRGAEVTNLGTDRLIDMMEGECELEALCARLSSQHMSLFEKQQLQDVHTQMDVAVEAGDLKTYFQLNTQFHDLICAGVHNRTLDITVRDLRQRLSPFRRPLQNNQESKMRQSHAEHSAILKAILQSEPEAAYHAMRDHNARVTSASISVLRKR